MFEVCEHYNDLNIVVRYNFLVGNSWMFLKYSEIRDVLAVSVFFCRPAIIFFSIGLCPLINWLVKRWRKFKLQNIGLLTQCLNVS